MSGVVGSIARIAYLWADTLLGWWPKVGFPRRRASLVILDRGWLDLTIDPRRYRVSLPSRVIRILGRALPQPDLVLVLDGSVEVIRGRNPELEAYEIQRQLEAWRELARRNSVRFRVIDSSTSPEAMLGRALALIGDRLAARQRDLQASSLALRCLGRLKVGGKPYRLISTRREPRWLLPARVGAPGPRAVRLYRPAGIRHAAAALGLEAFQRTGVGARRQYLTVDVSEGLCSLVAERLGLRSFEAVAAVTGDWRRGERALLSLCERGKPAAFVKIAKQEGFQLEHEREVLDQLASCRLERIFVPEVIESFTWEGCTVLVLRPLDTPRASTNRAIREPEVAALAELATLSQPLAQALGVSPGMIPVHGDFAPWNSAPQGTRGLFLWDWEWTHLGLPLEDLFQWRLQRLVRFGQGSVAKLVGGALSPDRQVRELSERLGINAEVVAPRALRAYLERSVGVAGEMRHLPRVPTEALALLDQRGF